MVNDRSKEFPVFLMYAAQLTRRIRHGAPFVLLLPILFFLAGCGGNVTAVEGPETVSIAAGPNSITAGASSVLSVSATAAASIMVTGSDGSSYAMTGSGGMQTVSPAVTTTYTAVASGPGGKVTASALITVAAPGAPTVNITATPASVIKGSSATLAVTATNATAVTLAGSDGTSFTLSATGGSESVSPSATTTYTATAKGAGGTATNQVVVTVSLPSAPAVMLSAAPSTINAGGSSTLTATATNATGVTVNGTDGTSFSLSSTGGSQSVTPSVTTTYTATAAGAAGATSATAMTTVTVSALAQPTVMISASPASITTGSSSTLTVTATNATGVTVSGSDGSSFTLSSTGGTHSVSPTATTTYTATATGATGTTAATATAMVTVSALAQPAVMISASPTSITTGGSSTLTVTATNATGVTISGSDGSSFTLSSTGGTHSVSPTATTTYTATATGATGTTAANATAMVTVSALAQPTVMISASPTSIATGSSSTLTVSATNATGVTISGSDGSSFALSSTGGTHSVSPTATTTYTATATGATGTTAATASTMVSVTAASGTTVSISANPMSFLAGSGTKVTLTITVTQASSVVITGSDGSSAPVSAAGGTLTVTPTSTTTYTATATGATSSPSASVTVTVAAAPASVSITANPATIVAGNKATLSVTASSATSVTITGSDNTSYTLSATGGNQVVSPLTTTTYTASATGPGNNGTPTTANATLTVTTTQGSVQSINHIIFMLQENHSFDNYFGMLNPYRAANGFDTGTDGTKYTVDGLDDKLTTIKNESDQGTVYQPFKFTSTCVDDMTSSWLESYGDMNRYDFASTRQIKTDGFVHTAQGFNNTCAGVTGCGSGVFTDPSGQRAMGYYDQGFLNYYYYMASQFAVSDRWFSPVSSKSIPNRIATYTGGTIQGLVHDPGNDDHLQQLMISTLMSKLDAKGVTWKIYYTETQGGCIAGDDCTTAGASEFPATNFGYLQDSYHYLYVPSGGAACVAPTVLSGAVGDKTNSFCVDPNHIQPLTQYFADVANGTLPQYSFIEAGYSRSDEHPGSGKSILIGQAQVANVVNSLMTSPSWKDSVFFLAYDEGGGPYDHVPPVPNHTNDNFSFAVGTTPDASLYPDISTIAVNPDSYVPCLPAGGGPATTHCDLGSVEPGAAPTDAAAISGMAAQLGFRVPNIVISPFTKQHYVSHIPMDHTAILRFVEDRFIGDHQYLTQRDASQPNLLDFFDFTGQPWIAPPTPPAPVQDPSNATCTPTAYGP